MSTLRIHLHGMESVNVTFTFTFMLVIHSTFCRRVSFKATFSNDTNFQKEQSVTVSRIFFLIYSYSMVSGFSQGNYINRQENQKKNILYFVTVKAAGRYFFFRFSLSPYNWNMCYLISARISWYAHFLSLKLFVIVTRFVLEG